MPGFGNWAILWNDYGFRLLCSLELGRQLLIFNGQRGVEGLQRRKRLLHLFEL